MADNDPKYSHWLDMKPKNISERNASEAPGHGGMQASEPCMDWGKIRKENPSDDGGRNEPFEARTSGGDTDQTVQKAAEGGTVSRKGK